MRLLTKIRQLRQSGAKHCVLDRGFRLGRYRAKTRYFALAETVGVIFQEYQQRGRLSRQAIGSAAGAIGFSCSAEATASNPRPRIGAGIRGSPHFVDTNNKRREAAPAARRHAVGRSEVPPWAGDGRRGARLISCPLPISHPCTCVCVLGEARRDRRAVTAHICDRTARASRIVTLPLVVVMEACAS